MARVPRDSLLGAAADTAARRRDARRDGRADMRYDFI